MFSGPSSRPSSISSSNSLQEHIVPSGDYSSPLSSSTSSFPRFSSSPHISFTPSSPPSLSPLSPSNPQRTPSYNVPKPERPPGVHGLLFSESAGSPRLHSEMPRHPSEQVLEPPRRTESPFRFAEQSIDVPRRTESPSIRSLEMTHLVPDYTATPFRTASPRTEPTHANSLSLLHEKMASTLPKLERSNPNSNMNPSERTLSYSDIPNLRNAEGFLKHSDSAPLQLNFKHVDDRPDDGSPWEDGSSIRVGTKTRRETDSKKYYYLLSFPLIVISLTIINCSRNPRPRKFPPVSPPNTPSGTPDPLTMTTGEEVLEDLLPQDVKIQRAHLQQQYLIIKVI